LKSTFTLQRYKKTGLKDLPALNGVESDFANPVPCKYEVKKSGGSHKEFSAELLFEFVSWVLINHLLSLVLRES
jgi:hypothetical protein